MTISWRGPSGGLFFGHFSDRMGRKPMLVATLLLVGGGTLLIGLLPTYASIGIWAPVVLLIRLVQGFGAGAEYGGAVIMALEFAPPVNAASTAASRRSASRSATCSRPASFTSSP
jgi:MFS family permease